MAAINGITVIPIQKFVKTGYRDAEVGKTIRRDDDAIADVDESLFMEADFGLGANYRTLKDKEMEDYLSRVNSKSKTTKDKYGMPFVHPSNITIVDENNKKFDLNALRRAIMQRPSSLLKQNEKMQHGSGEETVFYNIGLPALKGLAVNESTGEFVVVDTCPGAGKCKIYCYARQGSYIQWKAVSLGQSRVLNFLMNEPEEFVDVLSAEIMLAQAKTKKKGTNIIVRWHDAGDFFSPEYLEVAYEIARKFPKIKFYAYTKIASVALGEKPENFIVNFSEGALPKEQKKIDLVTIKNSQVVPRALFFDLISRKGSNPQKDSRGRWHFRDEAAWDEFKVRVAKTYHIPLDSIISYDEMEELPVGPKPVWNVVVAPGEADLAATRKDVIGSLLLQH